MFTIIWVRLLNSYEPVHPTQIGVMSIGKRNEGNLQSKRARKTALYLLNYSSQIKLRFVLTMQKLSEKLLHTQERVGCTASHYPLLNKYNRHNTALFTILSKYKYSQKCTHIKLCLPVEMIQLARFRISLEPNNCPNASSVCLYIQAMLLSLRPDFAYAVYGKSSSAV